MYLEIECVHSGSYSGCTEKVVTLVTRQCSKTMINQEVVD